MTDRELMQQALEALDWAADCIEPRKPHNCDCPVCVASDALRERLAQHEALDQLIADSQAMGAYDPPCKTGASCIGGKCQQCEAQPECCCGEPNAPGVVHRTDGPCYMKEQPEQCRSDGRCQYAIDHGAEGLGHCPPGKCCMPAQPEQEPVAWINWSALTGERRLGWQCESELASEPLYTIPHRDWHGLTNQEIDEIYERHGDDGYVYERAIEAKLKEKNA